MADSTLSNLTSLTLPSQATDLLLVGRGTARPNKVAMSDALNSAALAATTTAYGVVLLAPNGGTTAGTVVQANDSRLTGGGGGGVTSLAGTANQISVSAATGAVTLSLPSNLIAPGTITVNTSGSFIGDGGAAIASRQLTVRSINGSAFRTVASFVNDITGAGATTGIELISDGVTGLAQVFGPTYGTATYANGAYLVNGAANGVVGLSAHGAGGSIRFVQQAFGNEIARFAPSSANLLIGGTTDIAGSSGLKVFGNSASTNTTSGALQVVGGIGVGGAINAGGTISTFSGGVTRTSLNTDGTLFWGVSANLGVLTWDTNKARVGAQGTADFALTTGTSTDRLRISGTTGDVTIINNATVNGTLTVNGGASTLMTSAGGYAIQTIYGNNGGYTDFYAANGTTRNGSVGCETAGEMYVGTRANKAVYWLVNNSAVGTLTTASTSFTNNLIAAGTGSHIFGTTNTVTLSSGAVTATGIISTTGGIQRIISNAGAFQIYKDATPTWAARLSFNTAATDTLALGVYDGIAWSDPFRVTTTQVAVTATTASTGITSGALVVSGGVGVAKELYVGSATQSTSNTTGGLVLSGGLGVALNLNMGGRLFINNTSAANGALSASAVVATFGADGVLGGLGFTVKGFPSATAGSRYIQLAAADTLDFRELRINDLGGNVRIGASTSAITVSGTLTATGGIIDPPIIGTILEDIFTITDGAAFEVDPGNGSIQLITLGASRTPKATNFAAGESITLMVNDGTAYTLTWTDATWGTGGVVWVGGTAPTLATSGYTVIQFWKVGTQVYGARVGDVA
jgi:hypothetical protein